MKPSIYILIHYYFTAKKHKSMSMSHFSVLRILLRICCRGSVMCMCVHVLVSSDCEDVRQITSRLCWIQWVKHFVAATSHWQGWLPTRCDISANDLYYILYGSSRVFFRWFDKFLDPEGGSQNATVVVVVLVVVVVVSSVTRSSATA